MPPQTLHTVTLNGESAEIAPDSTIADVLRERGLDPSDPKGIAVAVNEEVVPKSTWGATHISAGDNVEVITARQGG